MKIKKIVSGKTSNIDISKTLIGCKEANYRTKQLMQRKINENLKQTNKHKNRRLQFSYT